MNNKWVARFVALVAALGISLAVLLFWGRLGNAFRNAMVIVYAEPKPPPTDPNEVTVTIIPPAHCTKDHPCPASPPK